MELGMLCFEFINCEMTLVGKGTVTTPGGSYNFKLQAIVCAPFLQNAAYK